MSTAIKDGGGTSIRGIQPEMAIAHKIVADVFAEYNADCVITAGTDSKHKNSSRHYCGYALDFRIRTLEETNQEFAADIRHDIWKNRVQEVCEKIQARLGSEFDVINEFERLHIHVEFDPKRPLNEQV